MIISVKNYSMSNDRLFVYDLETTHLNAYYGVILCASFMHKNKQYWIGLEQKDIKREDFNLVNFIANYLKDNSADIDSIVGYFSNSKFGFDNRFLLSRMLRFDFRLGIQFGDIDLFTVAKRLKTNLSLEVVSDFLDLEDKKFKEKPQTWLLYFVSRKARQDMERYNRNDVITTYRLYNKISHLIQYVPKVRF